MGCRPSTRITKPAVVQARENYVCPCQLTLGKRHDINRAFSFYLSPLREGRRSCATISAMRKRFLLTPLREGRLLGLLVFLSAPSISTHAPARGATGPDAGPGLERPPISTHAPARGATPRTWPTDTTGPRFLLTPLREGRPVIEASTGEIAVRFLLTPLREGRPKCCRMAAGTVYFYSRPCERGD